MKIRHIRIQNYRSVKHADITPTDIVALVGPNNAGKTNILSAVNFLLGERFPTRQALDATDYYDKDLSRTIHIQVWFHEVDNPDRIETVWATCPGNEGRLEARFRRFGGIGENYLSNDVRDRCALVYLDAARNFDGQFGSSRWSLFGRIVRQLDANFRSSVAESVRREVEDHLNRAQELLKTPLYRSFETAIVEAFQEQVRLTTHQVKFDFRTFDPLNFYKGLHPILIEDGEHRNPSEAGSGMRNLIVMALFRAYAKAFRGDAIIAMEEPEIYLHPHAQRSLASLFEELASQGAQIFYSTHSAAFIDVARADRVVFVERGEDGEEEVCTQVRNVSADELLRERQRLHPSVPMTVGSMQERYRNICGPEHAEAFFARAVLIVEGPTETAALPIYAKHLDVDFGALGISVVSADGKGNADQLFQLYATLGFPTYLVFDNDRDGNGGDIKLNEVLTRMLGMPESDMPDGTVGAKYAIIEGNFEKAVKRDLEAVEPGLYDKLRREAEAYLGSNAGKALIAKFMARRLVERDTVPDTVRQIVEAVKDLVVPEDEEAAEDDVPPWDRDEAPVGDDDEVPF